MHLQINTWNVFDTAVPFGGYKMSGIGREHGEEILHHYTQVPFISVLKQRLRGPVLCSVDLHNAPVLSNSDGHAVI